MSPCSFARHRLPTVDMRKEWYLDFKEVQYLVHAISLPLRRLQGLLP